MEANKENTSEHKGNKLSRLLTLICDNLPAFGKIREHRFTTSLGAGVTFSQAQQVFHQGQKHETFTISIDGGSPLWTAMELRDLAQECVAMAEYLEKHITPTNPN